MSFDQLASGNKLVVDADSFRAQSSWRPMSRRHIMHLSSKVTEIAGLACNSLFDTTSVYAAMQDSFQVLLTVSAPASCFAFDSNIACFDENDHLTAVLLCREVEENRAIPATHFGDIQLLATEKEQVSDIVAIPEGIGR